MPGYFTENYVVLADGPIKTLEDVKGKRIATNAIGSLLMDKRDASGNTLYAGTGEPNASNDSEAGVGIYKTSDGGATWALVPGSDIFFQRAIGQMAIDKKREVTWDEMMKSA